MSDIAEKPALRKIIREKLKANAPFRNEKSTLIWDALTKIKDFQEARNHGQLMVYLDFDLEVQTAKFLRDCSGSCFFPPENGFIIPYCQDNEIAAVKIFSFEETETGSFGILEPKKEIINNPKRTIPPADIRFVLVPGLAFDRQGNRLGRGKGYYDRFLSKLSAETITVGLAFECQIFENVPAGPNDKPVSRVITENS